MIEEHLITQFESAKTETLLENTEYNFRIKLIQPKEASFQLLYTDGMSLFEQEVSEKYKEFKHVELYFCLPHYWNLKTNNWPLVWLEKLATLPQKNKTWYGPGDTIPAGNPPKALSEICAANHFMLAEPIDMKAHLTGPIWEEKGIHFFGVIPILQPELDYKLRNSATVLTSRLIHKGHSEKIDIYRASVCRKRFLGF